MSRTQPHHVYRITELPQILTLPAPVLSVPEQIALARAQVRIAESPELFDAPQWMVTQADEKRLLCYEATFAHLLAARECPSIGEGAVSVRVVIRTHEGQWLWTQRSQSVAAPGLWALGIAGIVDLGNTILAAAEAEMSEELHLGSDDYEPLRPLAMIQGGALNGAGLVLETRLSADAAPRRSDEVTAVAYSDGFDEHPSPLWDDSATVIAGLRGLERLGL